MTTFVIGHCQGRVRDGSGAPTLLLQGLLESRSCIFELSRAILGQPCHVEQDPSRKRNSAAERSAAAAVIALKEEQVAAYLKSNVALMEEMIKEGYQSAATLRKRIEACRTWLEYPTLIKRDAHAGYKAVVEIDLAEIKESLVACPNDPDDVKPLSQVAGDPVQEVFIGSCMTNIGHFRAAGRILDKAGQPEARIWLTPPTKMDAAQLKREGFYAIFVSAGARMEIPGCSLCMGNQARVRPKTTVFSTSTRNFDHRMGDSTRVYLGSAELAAVAALKGKIPAFEEYLEIMKEKVLPGAADIYRYLEFHKVQDFSLDYVR